MPHLATSRSPAALAQAVKAMHQRFRFLAAVMVPDIATGSGPSPDRIALYGSETSCTEALIEATTNHPGCERFGEYEYLPNSVIADLLAANASDPLTQGLKSLGRVKPDDGPLS